jgi:tetratricopeptide (TPR) repeat protein
MNLNDALKRANSFRASGQYMEAKGILSDLIERFPKNEAGLNALGQVCMEMNAWDEAESWYDRAIQTFPDKAILYKNLADAQTELGKLAQAKANYDKAIAIDPRFFQAHANLGNLLLRENDAKDAIEHFLQAVMLRPEIAELHDSLGCAFAKIGIKHMARAAFLQALKLNPNLATAHYNLADRLMCEGHFKKAVQHFNKAIALAPNLSIAQAGLAHVLIALGKTAEAANIIRTLTTKGDVIPKELMQRLYGRLAAAEKRYTEALAIWQAMAQSIDADHSSLRFAGVGLAKLYDEMGDYAAAFEAINKVHALNPQVFDRVEVRNRVDRLIELYSVPGTANLPKATHSLLQPVFVFGMPRAGKSLTEKLLSFHPKVFGLDEQHTIDHLQLPKKPGHEHLSHEEHQVMLSTDELNQLAKDFIDIADEYMNDDRKSMKDGITHVVSASPGNSWVIPLIHRMFPNAPLIYVNRHPLDNCLSNFFNEYEWEGAAYTKNLEDLGIYYLQHQRLMIHWRDKLKIPMLEVRYEDIVTNPVTSRNRICEYIKLDLQDESATHEIEPNMFFTSLVGHWRQYREHLQPLIGMLGEIDPKTLEASGAAR